MFPTPDDFKEPTHVNVRPCSWWIERFAEHGFRLDADFDAGFIAAHAMRFRAGPAVGSPLDPLLAQRHGLLRQLAALHIDNAVELKGKNNEVLEALIECTSFINWRSTERGGDPLMVLSCYT